MLLSSTPTIAAIATAAGRGGRYPAFRQAAVAAGVANQRRQNHRANSINFAIDSENKTAYDDPPKAASGGHGTHVAGIIVKGTPKQVKVMAVRVFDLMGSSSIMTITLGVDYAREKKAPVLNMSLGHASPTQKEKDWMNDSFKKSLAERVTAR